MTTQRVPKPKWLRVKLPTGETYKNVRNRFGAQAPYDLESGHCPNMGECWEKDSDFYDSGNICTRLWFL